MYAPSSSIKYASCSQENIFFLSELVQMANSASVTFNKTNETIDLVNSLEITHKLPISVIIQSSDNHSHTNPSEVRDSFAIFKFPAPFWWPRFLNWPFGPRKGSFSVGKTNTDCGNVRHEGAYIIGGSDATVGSIPWQVIKFPFKTTCIRCCRHKTLNL